VLCCTASPRPPPFAPPAPLPVAQLCSSVSQLLWQSLTSHVRSSSAMAPRLPDADQIASLRLAGRGTSRFPCNELPHMPGSSTTPGPPGARAYAPVCIAFRLRNGVNTRNMNLSGAGWPMCSSADASLPPSQATAHGSWSMWIATPSRIGLAPTTHCRSPGALRKILVRHHARELRVTAEQARRGPLPCERGDEQSSAPAP
jgi:hypothetical protein